jgi:hypothetical protein
MKSDLDFNKLFGRIRDIDQGKKTVTESSLAECGMMPDTMSPNIPTAQPVSMSVNLNAQGIDNIKELIQLMHKADSPLAAGLVGGMSMPAEPMPTLSSPPALNMEPAMTIPMAPPVEPQPGVDPLDDIIKKAGMAVKPKDEPAPQGAQGPEDKKEGGEGSDAPAPKEEMNKVADEVKDMADTLADVNDGGEKSEEYINSPDEKYGDVSTVTATGNDLASKGKEAPKVNGGGNPMESIRKMLDARYKEIKEAKAKPDYIDADGDGDKKEPMKKAFKDKEVKEAGDRPATKKTGERDVTLPSGAKVKAHTYQGHQSQKADKEANKERKASYKA